MDAEAEGEKIEEMNELSAEAQDTLVDIYKACGKRVRMSLSILALEELFNIGYLQLAITPDGDRVAKEIIEGESE